MRLEDYKGKKILLTGGTGFLGKNLVPVLERLGAVVKAVGSKAADLTDIYQTEKIMGRDKYDIIFHAAALQGAGDYPMFHQAEQFTTNIQIHLNVLSCWYDYQPQARLVGIESTCSYPGNIPILPESSYWQGPMHESVEFYGMTKKVLHMGIEAYKTQYGLKGTCPVFATLYGPHDDFDLTKAHVVSALVKKFCDAKSHSDKAVIVWGDGHQTRELIFVEDQIVGLLMMADCDEPIINIGTGVETSIRNLAETIKRLSGFEGEIVYDVNQFVGVRHKVLDISRAKKLYGWTTENKMHSLEEGIKKTIKWYKEQV